MNVSPWLIYFWTVLDYIKSTFLVLFVVSFTILLVTLIWLVVCHLEDFKDSIQKTKKILKHSFIGTVVVWFLFVFTPSSKDFALIYLIPKVANSQFVNQVSKKSAKNLILMLEVAEKELQKRLKEDAK